MSGHH